MSPPSTAQIAFMDTTRICSSNMHCRICVRMCFVMVIVLLHFRPQIMPLTFICEFGHYGIGICINELGLPPVGEPHRQVWFHMLEGRLKDQLTMCLRAQVRLTGGVCIPMMAAQDVLDDTRTDRICANCGDKQSRVQKRNLAE